MEYYDAIVISDIHIGSHICQSLQVIKFLRSVRHKEINTNRLIINGDLFDDLNFTRLNKYHWEILSEIRKLSKTIDLVINLGNHDGAAEVLSHLLGIEVLDDYKLQSGSKMIYFHHGDRYDKFLTDHPILVWIGDTIYSFLQKIDPSFKLAIAAKKSSKSYLRNSEIIKEKSLEFARKHGYNAVITGHTHHSLSCPEGEIEYYNTGSWTEPICTFITIQNGCITLREFANVDT